MDDGVVIVGAGHGGVQTAASLREEGYEGRVTLVDAGLDLPYHRPPLSKAFLKDPSATPQILRSEGFYDGAAIALRLGDRAERIDLVGRRLTLASGEAIGFDRLVLATGSLPRILSLPGSDLAGILSLRSIDDARALRDRAATAGDVVILGGGFIGLEVAATMAAGGRRVTVIEAQDRLLARAVAREIAAHVRGRLEAMGITILTGTTIDRFVGSDGTVTAVETSDGRRIPASMVVVGIGVVANGVLAEQAGITTGNGVRVDGRLQSSAEQVLSVGDNANFRHWQSGTDLRLESVQNATDQARLAARTIVGHHDAFASVPWFWSDIGDMKLQMVGLNVTADATEMLGDPEEGRFSLFHYAGERLVAIESVNRPADHMLGRKMIAAGFSPERGSLAGGDLKARFAAWEVRGPTPSAAP